MIKSRIRQISVETVVNVPDSDETKFINMIYTIGATRNFEIDGVKVKRTISDILETENGFKLYITNENTTQEWIELYDKKRVTKFNFID